MTAPPHGRAFSKYYARLVLSAPFPQYRFRAGINHYGDLHVHQFLRPRKFFERIPTRDVWRRRKKTQGRGATLANLWFALRSVVASLDSVPYEGFSGAFREDRRLRIGAANLAFAERLGERHALLRRPLEPACFVWREEAEWIRGPTIRDCHGQGGDEKEAFRRMWELCLSRSQGN